MEPPPPTSNNQKKKFVCKFCHKRYPCGKSLGGHIRTHMNSNVNSAAKFNIDKIFNGRSSKKESEAAASASVAVAGGQSSYGLRENPKRSKRFVDSNSPTLHHDLLCKECGKGFSSLKALCGHMASHSEKDKMIKLGFEDEDDEEEDVYFNNDVKQKLIMDSESDTETSAPSRPRRSKTMDYKTIGVYSSSFDLPNGSSSVSGIEQEQEEVAICLMMLSRDCSAHKKAGLNSFADSSDNNSVVLEAKSSSIDMRITVKNGVNFVSNRSDFVQMKKPPVDEVDVSDNSDSGYFRNGPKKVESDASVDGFIRTGKSRVEYESGFVGKNYNKRTEIGIKVEDYGPRKKFESRKRTKNESSSSPEMLDSNNNIPQKRTKFECLTCNKVFNSHRSLWGHTASHSRINMNMNIYCESTNESGENSIETDSSPVPVPNTKTISSSNGNGKSPMNVEKRSTETKKTKGHECPFCFRVFKSGQALGGHKRSHFVGGGDENRPVIIKQNLDNMPVIDLNLPAPIDEEAIGNAGFFQW